MIQNQNPVVTLRGAPPKTRSCSRCGAEFQTYGYDLICSNCHRPRPPRISFRESQVIELIRQAKSTKEIAFELHLAESSVKQYINHIFRKLSVRSRTELAVLAIQNPERVKFQPEPVS